MLTRGFTTPKNKECNHKEIIVVDDGSTNRTREIVLNFKNKKIKLLRNKKRKMDCYKSIFKNSQTKNIGFRKRRYYPCKKHY
ncbi:MAG: glycosyltransferase [Nanoarchaeota archaeon]|nr:glycosyltransferase [Nanoarchaeota archaeon]